jgi:hypothetical protein
MFCIRFGELVSMRNPQLLNAELLHVALGSHPSKGIQLDRLPKYLQTSIVGTICFNIQPDYG